LSCREARLVTAIE